MDPEGETPSPEASGAAAEGGSTSTPADSTQVPDSESQATPNAESQQAQPQEDVLKYSEKSYLAAQELARSEARTSTLREREETDKERRQRLSDAVTAAGDGLPSVVRDVQAAIRQLSSDLTVEEMEPAIKRVRDAHGTVQAAAFEIAKSEWRRVIQGVFTDEAESKAFWEKAAGLDPSLDASTILPLISESHALSTEAVRTADPEVLVKANPKLVKHISELEDAAYKRGRDQGRLDPTGDPTTGDGSGSRPASTSLTVEEAKTLPIAELAKRRQLAASR